MRGQAIVYATLERLGISLVGRPRLGIHPNGNSATLFVTYPDIVRIAQDHGNVIHYVE